MLVTLLFCSVLRDYYSTPTLIKSIPPLLHELKLNMNFRALLEFLEMYIFYSI